MYSVDLSEVVRGQIDALPGGALAAFAEVRVVLETAPWSGHPYAADLPDGPMRVRFFGQAGMVVYLILDATRTVEVLTVIWGM